MHSKVMVPDLPKVMVPDIPKVMGRRQFLLQQNAILKPVKRIHDSSLLEDWAKSEAYLRLLDFLQSCNRHVSNIAIGDECFISPASRALLEMLEVLEEWINDLPPDTSTASRFGNIVFRSWIARLEEKALELHQILLQCLGNVKNSDAITELVEYFIRSFGDGTRMDYGSGHELAFIAWLTCLDILGWISSKDYQAIVLIVFVKYLDLVRKLQKTYNLEPAGVWGLDDFQFIPYFWGAAQLLNHPKIKPKTIMNKEIVQYFSNKYMYLACIDYINQNKNGPFHEHSPILYDISGVAEWAKVNSGMLKMYIAEVLLKFPVVQHFVFGSLLPFRPADNIEPE